MPKRDSKGPKKRQNQPKKTKNSSRKGNAAHKDSSTERFVNDLITRGEAVDQPQKGRLPLHATHVIKRQNPEGPIEVERVRYKAF